MWLCKCLGIDCDVKRQTNIGLYLQSKSLGLAQRANVLLEEFGMRYSGFSGATIEFRKWQRILFLSRNSNSLYNHTRASVPIGFSDYFSSLEIHPSKVLIKISGDDKIAFGAM